MNTIICPECGKEYTVDTKTCQECGFQFEEKVRRCQECGEILAVNSTYCKNCGFENTSRTEIKKLIYDHRKVVGSISILLACILIIISFTRINNEDYQFYAEHYNKCMMGYEESIYMAKTSSGYFSLSYENIADSYKEMADDDMMKLNGFRIQAGIGLFVSLGLLFMGYKILKKH